VLNRTPNIKRSNLLWILLGGMLHIAGIVGGTAIMIDSFRERAIANSKLNLENTTLLLGQHFDQNFEDLVDAHARLAKRLAIAGIASDDEYKSRLSTTAVHELLAGEISDTFDTDDIFLYDSDGKIINTSRQGPLPSISAANREYFQSLKYNLASADTVAEPVTSSTTGKPVIVIARRLTNVKGDFLGVMARRVDGSQFEKFLDTLVLGKHATISVVSSRGELMAEFPRVEDIADRVHWGPVFQEAVASRHGPATARVLSPFDGTDGLASARLMRHFPVVVIASITIDAALADWREQTRLLIVVACLVTAVIAAVFLLIGWQAARERRASEQRLAIGKQRLDTALNNMSQGICLFGADKRLVISNRRFREIYRLDQGQDRPGTAYHDILGYGLKKGGKPDHVLDFAAEINAARSDYTFRTSDGRVIAIRRALTPDGGWVSTHDDITERERATEALKIAKDAAEAASRVKSDFLAVMSHEIRTPMAGMMGMIDLLAATELDGEQQDLANIAHESARNLLTVVNNILDFSKLEAGQLEPESIPFSIRHSIDAVALLLAPKARDQGLQLKTTIDEEVPTYLSGDPSRLGQILLNLVGNAIKFTEQGAVEIAVSHGLMGDGLIALRIEIIDSGAGIAPEVQASLFTPFMQADSSVSRKYGGSGLGLAICKLLCQTMGGEIGVESEVGRGSRFWFTLQCRAADAPPQIASASLAPAIDPAAASFNILVADDNAIIRRLISKLLERQGYRPDLVCNGQEAVAAVRERRYDLVLMDMQMPEMDGISATRAIRALAGPAREVPIIALTANALVGQRESCLAAGMNDFLTKPIQPELLYAAILQWGTVKDECI
jgi:signal transduction histidine kinase/ActR/RegA family two-component response regulator